MPTTALVADDSLAWSIEDMRARVGLRVVFRTDPVAKIGALLRRGEALVVIGDDAPHHHGPRPLVVSVTARNG